MTWSLENLNNWIGSQEFWKTIVLIALMVVVAGLFRKKRWNGKRFLLETGKNAEISDGLFNQSKRSSYDTLRSLGTMLIIIIFVLIILSVNGMDVSTAVTGLGILGTIVGFACQDIIKDTIMGVRIVVDEFFLIGDAVRINDIKGVVIDFNIRHTKIEDIATHSVICICNGLITSVERLSHLMIIEIPINDVEPKQRVKGAIQHMCADIWLLDGIENCYFKGISKIEAGTVYYDLWVFTKVEKQNEIKYQALAAVKDWIEKEELKLPTTGVELKVKEILGIKQENL